MFDVIQDQPLLALVAAVVVALLVWAVVKRLLKMALFLLLCLAALFLWLKLTGQEVPDAMGEVGSIAGRVAKDAVEKGVEAYRQSEGSVDSLRDVN